MTPEQGFQRQNEIYRQMTPQQRLQVSFELDTLARTLVRAGVRHQHPDWNENQVEQEVLRRFRLAAGIQVVPQQHLTP
jgi:hypothetical protein